MTHYEKILSEMERSAGIETVAEVLSTGKGRCSFCNNHPETCSGNCKEGVTEWLESEVEE